MKVILNQDIPNLGEEGDIKDVAPGYARNFLMPRKMVMRFDESSLAVLENRREEIEQRKEEKRKAALGLKERLESEELQVPMPAGANGRLYGSVTAAKLADELEKLGVTIERKRIDIPENTIKATGPTTVKVGLYGGEVASLRVNVVGQDVQGGRSAESAARGEAATSKEKQPTADVDSGAAAPDTPSDEQEAAAADTPSDGPEPVAEVEDGPEAAAAEESAAAEDAVVAEASGDGSDDPGEGDDEINKEAPAE